MRWSEKTNCASSIQALFTKKKKLKTNYLRRCTITKSAAALLTPPFKHTNCAFLSATQTPLHSRLRQKRKEKQHSKSVFFLYIILESLFSFDQDIGDDGTWPFQFFWNLNIKYLTCNN